MPRRHPHLVPWPAAASPPPVNISQPTFNPDPQIAVVKLGNGRDCYVVDDVLTDPERLRRFAVAHRPEFVRHESNAFPGLMMGTPAQVNATLNDFVALHIRRLLGGRRTVQMSSRLAMVMLPPEMLEPRQCIAHHDASTTAAGQCLGASVLYLFQDESLGGTGFFEPRKPLAEITRLMDDACTMSRDQFQQRHGVGLNYPTESNDYFELVGVVPAKWNRMIFYDGAMFHSGHIQAPGRLSADPATGRLTLNGFFTFRQSL